ncbi:hybrid sensor histidine kinase/response regulator, partial [Bacteroides sp. OttesenSCG-928-M17]|nr:hybrid sensor histidine kinase/response regulator [Bacteroides sp. OttesenSCG-928-M17]
MIVEHYSVDQGLPNNIVNCSLKGSDGFIWFGTWYGLCSFDGVRFKTYNNRDGFYSDIPPRKIQSIVEDKNGFLWIKTIDRKLYVFDKHQERFYAVYDDVKDYSGNTQIIKIQNTPDGDVLLLTKDKNLLRAYATEERKIEIELLHDASTDINVYDSKLKYNVFSETTEYLCWIGIDFQILSCRKGEELLGKPANFILRKMDVPSVDIFTCAHEGADRVWLGDKMGKLYSVNPQTGSVSKYDLPGINRPIRNILITEAGIAYLSVEGQGTYEYDLGYKELTKLPLEVDPAKVSNSFIDKYDKVWFVENENTLYYYDPLNKNSKRFAAPAGVGIGSFKYQDAGEQGLFFLTSSGEILLFNRESLSVIRMNQLKFFSDIQPNLLFFDQMLDEDGILWLSSSSTGIYRVNFPKKQFKLLESFSGVPTTVNSSKGARGLYQTRNGDIWMGTRWGDLYRLGSNHQLKQLFSAASGSFVGNVYHIMEDNKGNLWFSTKGNGLIKAEPDILAPNGFRFTRYLNDVNVLSSINHNDVYFTYQDSKGRIWAGLFGGGLNLLSEEGGEVTFKHRHNGFKHYPSYGLYLEVRNITEDDNGRIWVGTTDGLMSFDVNFNSPEEIAFEIYRDESASSNIADNDIYVLYKDANSQIWVSVFGGGLNKLIGYDEQSKRPVFKIYGMREGLNTDVVVSIVEDEKDHLWLATESGLSCFDKQTELFRNYDKYDGFLNIRMEEGSALRTSGGDLWLGCREGVLVFNPEKLETVNADFKTFIVDFKISNKDLRSFKDAPIITESIKYAESIELNYDQSMFTIEFAALNFFNPNRISYKYILDGYEKEWHFSGKNRIASYTNVTPG